MKRPGLISRALAPAPRYVLRLSLLENIFAKHLPKAGYAAIEFGPGLGDVAHYLAESPACRELTLIDFSQTTLAMIRERMRGAKKIHYRSDDLCDLQVTSQFDVVLAFEVLEHIDDDRQAFEKIFSLTAAQGQLIMSVPAFQKKWQKQDVVAGHLRRYERAELAEKLRGAGFTNVEIIDYGFPLTALMYPFRQTLYKPDRQSSQQERSKKSGVHRPLFSKIPLWILYPAYLPFIGLQKLFLNKDLGDGFIAIAKKT